jgi:hypothetical protein
MPQLGLGLGLHKSSRIETPLQALIKSASLYLSADKADGVSAGINSPLTNPWKDLKGVVGKNLADPVKIELGKRVSASTGITVVDATRALLTFTEIQPNTRYSISASRHAWYDQNKVYISGSDSAPTAPSPSNARFIQFDVPIASASTIQLELGSTATAYEPYGKANCLLQAFAGTTADGWTVETINGKTNTFLNLDGLNSFGQFANMDVLNPVGTDDFCQMVVFRPDDTLIRIWGVTRNASGEVIFGIAQGVSGNIVIVLNGGGYFAITPNTTSLIYVLYGRINGRRFANFNGVESFDSIYTTLLTSTQNTQLNCRSNSADGLTKANFAKGLQGDIAFWKGAQGTLDKDKIVSLVAKAMKQKYNLGV